MVSGSIPYHVNLARQQGVFLLKPRLLGTISKHSAIFHFDLSCWLPFLLSLMKLVAFFCSTWVRKNKDQNTAKGKQDVSATKQVVSVPKSAPYTHTMKTFEVPAPRQLSDHKTRSQSEDPISFQVASAFARKASSQINDASSTCSIVDHEIMISTSPALDHPDIGHSPRNLVVRKSSHRPSKSAVLPKLNIYSPVSGTPPRSAGKNEPVRPPRPPPLNLHCTTTKRPLNTGISPPFVGNRAITLTSSPNSCAIKPVELAVKTGGSSNDSSLPLSGHEEYARQPLEETACGLCVAASPDDNYVCPHQSVVRKRRAVANPYFPSKSDPLLPASPTLRAAQAVPDSSAPQRIYQSIPCTSSTPYLPSRIEQEVPPVPSLPFISSNGQADDVSNFPLSLFPVPPQSPLFIRRKINKNLMLRPGPTIPATLLPSSPSLTDVDYTPLATPTTPRLQPTTINHSKSFSNLPRYSSPRTIPPPLFNPPSTPLPTPPASPTTPIIRSCELSMSPISSLSDLLTNYVLNSPSPRFTPHASSYVLGAAQAFSE